MTWLLDRAGRLVSLTALLVLGAGAAALADGTPVGPTTVMFRQP